MYKINQDFITFVENNPKLVSKRESVRHSGLYVLKYSRKVFYDALWNDYLEECRGLVVDKDWNAVVVPFQKIYNRGENGTDFPRDAEVTVVRKVNGFMGAITYSESRNEIIYSTTGSLDSDFALLAEKHLKYFTPAVGYTWLFEICDPSDPHVIPEEAGAYLIGARSIHTGEMRSEEFLDSVAKIQSVKRPEWAVMRFSDAVKILKKVAHEGYVVRYGDKALKMKSPYYLITKFLGRMKNEKFEDVIDNKDFRKTIDEEFYPLLDALSNIRKGFMECDEQQKMEYIREFLGGNRD